jgi:hypothetical protein
MGGMGGVGELVPRGISHFQTRPQFWALNRVVGWGRVMEKNTHESDFSYIVVHPVFS